jgi:putative SOS response-associated peptidase YedK
MSTADYQVIATQCIQIVLGRADGNARELEQMRWGDVISSVEGQQCLIPLLRGIAGE